MNRPPRFYRTVPDFKEEIIYYMFTEMRNEDYMMVEAVLRTTNSSAYKDLEDGLFIADGEFPNFEKAKEELLRELPRDYGGQTEN